MAHRHGPPHFERQPKCGWLVAFVIFMSAPPPDYYLELSGQQWTRKLILTLLNPLCNILWAQNKVGIILVFISEDDHSALDWLSI